MSTILKVMAFGTLAALISTPSHAKSPRPPKRKSPDIRVSTVINTIKCQLDAVYGRPEYMKAIKPIVTANLSLDDVITKKVEVDGGVEFVIAGVTIDGALSGSSKRATTRSLSIDFVYGPAPGTKLADCSQPGATLPVEGEPISDVIEGILNEYKAINPGAPLVQLKAIKYSLTFDIVHEKVTGPTIKFLFIKIGETSTITRERKDVLSLSFDLTSLPATFLKPSL